MKNLETIIKYCLYPIGILAWLIAQPIKWLALGITRIKKRIYDPEKRPCPACAFRGDSGTAGKTCRIECIPTAEAERAAIKHTCFRCGAVYASALAIPADKWFLQAPKPEPK